MAKVTVTGAVAMGTPFLNVMVLDENVGAMVRAGESHRPRVGCHRLALGGLGYHSHGFGNAHLHTGRQGHLELGGNGQRPPRWLSPFLSRASTSCPLP